MATPAEFYAANGEDADKSVVALLRFLAKDRKVPQLTGPADGASSWVDAKLKEALRDEAAAGGAGGGLRPVQNCTVTAGAKRSFEKAMAAARDAPKHTDAAEEVIQPGTKCKRNGCITKYDGPQSTSVTCEYHPGVAIFHETFKFWSCCGSEGSGNRAWDWAEFEKIPPCKTGPETCAFTDEAAGIKKRAPCRHDMFQVGTGVTWNIYAKKVDPERSLFLISPTHVKVVVYFDVDKCFNYHAKLTGKVEPEQCKVEIKEPKIEVSLRKAADATGAAWERLGEVVQEEEEE